MDQLQQLTDKLFEQYKADLASNGFEIVPIEELWNHSTYQKNREKRWDLRSGQGGEKGDGFGAIVMRPTGQKFIVNKQSMENKISEFISTGLTAAKNFIFNKIPNPLAAISQFDAFNIAAFKPIGGLFQAFGCLYSDLARPAG